jgi:peroxiredoxin family protein
MFEAIGNQMRDRTPPETKQTYDRLKSEGFGHVETMKLIGCALTSEMFYVLKEERVYDEERYKKLLHALPELPWDAEDE